MPAPAFLLPIIPAIIKAKVAVAGAATATGSSKAAITAASVAKTATIVVGDHIKYATTREIVTGVAIGAGVNLGLAGTVATFRDKPRTGASDPRDNASFNPSTARSKAGGASDPRDNGSFNPDAIVTGERKIGRADPFAPLEPQFEPPSSQGNPRSPILQPLKTPKTPQPRGALGIDTKGAGGRINLAPINPGNTSALTKPKSLDQVSEGGVNLLTPIVAFLKKLESDIEELKLQKCPLPESDPLLKELAKLIIPLAGMIAAIPETFESGIVDPIIKALLDLLTPIADLTALSAESSIKNPRTTTEAVAELLGPILLVTTLIGAAIDQLRKSMIGMSMKTTIHIPQGMAVAAQLPIGLATAAQLPIGLAAAAQLPIGLAAAAQLPIGLAAAAQLPIGLAAAAQLPQSHQVLAILPQTITATADLTAINIDLRKINIDLQKTNIDLGKIDRTVTKAKEDIDIDLKKITKTTTKTKEGLEKCCNEINDRLKKKKKEDDDRFPEFKNAGVIECDGSTVNYDYTGNGLTGLNKQLDVILGINKMLIKKVCDIESPTFTFPDIFGGGTYVCDETFGTYNYSGVGLLGIQSQIDRVLDFNKKILNQVCDIEIEFPLIQGGGTYVCDETFGTYNYSGIGLLGLQNQIDRVLDFNKKILDEVCDIDVPASTFPDIFGGGTYACGSDVFDSSYSGAGFLGLSGQIDKLTAISTKILGEVCEPDAKISGDIKFLDCEGGTQILLYSGEGIIGLSTQVQALTELTKLTYAEACKTVTCVPVQPGDEFAEFDVPRQLVLTWGEEYPTQKGSLWHTQIPNPREDLDWCRDFDNLIFTKGNVYGRLLWGNSKIKSGMRCVDEDEAERILDLIAPLSVSEGKMRITKGGGVKLNPAVRPVRCVRAAIAQLDTEGLAVMVKCFVPPIEGCP